jgi:hypothetical protein
MIMLTRIQALKKRVYLTNRLKEGNGRAVRKEYEGGREGCNQGPEGEWGVHHGVGREKAHEDA